MALINSVRTVNWTLPAKTLLLPLAANDLRNDGQLELSRQNL